MKNAGIRAKLVALILVSAFIPLLCVGAGFYWLSIHTIEQSVEANSLAIVEEVIEEYTRLLKQRERQVDYFRHNQLLVDILQKKRQAHEVEALLKEYLAGERLVFVRLSLTDIDGLVQAEMSKDGVDDGAVGNETAALARLLFKSDYLLRSGGEHRIEGLKPGTGTINDGRYGYIVRLVVPITDFLTETPVGWLVADLHFNAFLMQGSLYSLMQHRHMAILAGEQMPANTTTAAQSESMKKFRQQRSMDLAQGQTGMHRIGDYQFVFGSIRHGDWTIVDIVRLSEFTEGPRKSTVWGVATTVLIALVTVCIMVLVVGRITARVRRITDAAEGFAAGNLNLRIETRSLDETGRLARSFNDMAASLQESIGKLSNLNDELEARVARRTLELERANKVVSKHNELLKQELQTAHDMQMGLMPTENPTVAGFDIVGRCRPATEVGGDFYQYFPLKDGRIIITVADVTGHGMQAAVPTMVFSGLLDTQIEYTSTPHELMPRLNNSLHRILERRTFVCFTVGELDPRHNRVRLSNGGCPYPYLYRASSQTVDEIALSALPLGIRAESSYSVAELFLEKGDLVVLCSDGIIEAANGAGELFGYERTLETIRQAGMAGYNGAELVDQIFAQLESFTGGGMQEDDQTMVVIRAMEDTPHLFT